MAKKYTHVEYKHTVMASSNCTVLPDMTTTEPPLGTIVGIVYDVKGDFMGFTTPEALKKYLVGGVLYLKGKRMYRVESRGGRSRRGGTTKIVTIIEKATNRCALFIKVRALEEDDLVDVTDKLALAQWSLANEILCADLTQYGSGINLTNFNDKYKLFTGLKEKFQKDEDVFRAAKKKELVEYAKELIDVLKRNKESTGEVGVPEDF